MKAIRVRYLPPTNHKGSRFKASADGWGSVTIPYDHGHANPAWLAALALIEKRNPKYISGLPTVFGYTDNGQTVFCFPESKIPWLDSAGPGQSLCSRCLYPFDAEAHPDRCPSCR